MRNMYRKYDTMRTKRMISTNNMINATMDVLHILPSMVPSIPPNTPKPQPPKMPETNKCILRAQKTNGVFENCKVKNCRETLRRSYDDNLMEYIHVQDKTLYELLKKHNDMQKIYGEYIHRNTEKVKENGMLLKNIHMQTPQMCLNATEQNGLALKYAKFHTPCIIKAAKKNNQEASKFQDNSSYLKMMEQNSLAAKYENDSNDDKIKNLMKKYKKMKMIVIFLIVMFLVFLWFTAPQLYFCYLLFFKSIN